MVEPRVIPRAEHPISRRDIDPDALKVLYRLRQFNHVAYLVGGSVRDLLLGRRPKDFDIGTSAHPYQVKKLFRNCWIIGRRFRLAHVKFGTKVIEVATFRRQVQPGEEIVQDGVPVPDPATHAGEHLLHRDNTFGTPEEDAFRRDFTINALVYDIATFSIIDYVNGLEDLQAGIVRSIGDPEVRFVEDPVRMLRAVALAARLTSRWIRRCSRRFGCIATRSRAARRHACSRSTTRLCARVTRRRRFAALPARGCSNRFPPSSIGAPTSRSGDRSPPWTRIAARSSRRPTRSPTRCCSEACSCRLASCRHRPAAHRRPPTTRAPRDRGWAICRWRGATSSA